MCLCYTVCMRLVDVIENCHLDQHLLDDAVVNNTILEHYSDGDLVHVIEIFLRGIGKHHAVDGKVIATFWDLCDWHKEHRSYTTKQQVYVIQNLIRYWNHVNLEMRSTIY